MSTNEHSLGSRVWNNVIGLLFFLIYCICSPRYTIGLVAIWIAMLKPAQEKTT